MNPSRRPGARLRRRPGERRQVAVQRDHRDRRLRAELRVAVFDLDRVDRVLERGVVELDHVDALGVRRPQPAGEVDVDDVEAARAEPEVARLGVDDHLVADLDLADQRRVGPRTAPLAADLDRRAGRARRPCPRRSFSIRPPPRRRRARRSPRRRRASRVSRAAPTLSAGVWLSVGAVGEQDALDSRGRAARWRRCRRRSRPRAARSRGARAPPARARTAGELDGWR